MSITNRQRGDYFERQARAALQARGWWVIRAAGSLGEADLVALRAGNLPMLISCKINPSGLRARERDALIAVAKRCDANPVLAHRPRGGFVRFVFLLGNGGAGWELDTLPVPKGTVRG